MDLEKFMTADLGYDQNITDSTFANWTNNNSLAEPLVDPTENSTNLTIIALNENYGFRYSIAVSVILM